MLFPRRMSRIFSTSWLSIPRFRLIFMDSVKVSGFAHFSAAFGEYLLMFSPDYVSSAYLVGGLAAEKLRTLSVCHLLPSLRLQVSLSCSPRPRAIMSCQRPELQARRHMPSGGAAVVDALTDRNTHVSNFSSVSVYIFVFFWITLFCTGNYSTLFSFYCAEHVTIAYHLRKWSHEAASAIIFKVAVLKTGA